MMSCARPGGRPPCREPTSSPPATLPAFASSSAASAALSLVEGWDTKSRLLASIDRARELIGYEPNTSFEVGLANTVQWFRKNWDKIEASAHFGPGVSAAVREMVQGSR